MVCQEEEVNIAKTFLFEIWNFNLNITIYLFSEGAGAAPGGGSKAGPTIEEVD